MVYMVNLGLFEEADGVITCFKIAKYLEKKNTRNKAIHAVIDAITASHTAVRDSPPTVRDSPPTVRDSPPTVRDSPPTVPRHAPLEVEVEVEVEVERSKSSSSELVNASQAKASTSGNKRQKSIQYEQIKTAYNEKFGFEVWARSSSVLTEKTKRQIAKLNPHMKTTTAWGNYFSWAAQDEWINGSIRDSDWKPDIDYLTREKTFAKLTDELHDRHKQR